MSGYEGLSAGDFGSSTKKRLPICFCLDVSGSMIAPTSNGKTRIDELNYAFEKFINTMKNDKAVSASADIAVVTFGGEAKVLKGFAPLDKTIVPKIEVNLRSLTPIGEAIQVGLKLLELRKDSYKKRGMKYYQPWLVVLTDGEPEGTGAVQEMIKASQMTLELEKERKIVVFNIGVGADANLDVLKKLSSRTENNPICVEETKLDELFAFLYSSSSEAVVNGRDPVDIFSGGTDIPKGKELDFKEWSI